MYQKKGKGGKTNNTLRERERAREREREKREDILFCWKAKDLKDLEVQLLQRAGIEGWVRFSLVTTNKNINIGRQQYKQTLDLQAQPSEAGPLARSKSTWSRVFRPRLLRGLLANCSRGIRFARIEEISPKPFSFVVLPMAVKSSVTLWAVLAEVSKKSRPASSAYSWAVYV